MLFPCPLTSTTYTPSRVLGTRPSSHHRIQFRGIDPVSSTIDHSYNQASSLTTTFIINTDYSSYRNIANPCSNKGSIVQYIKKTIAHTMV